MIKRSRLTRVIYLFILTTILCTGTIASLIVRSKSSTAIFVTSDKVYSNIYITSKQFQYYKDYISLHQSVPQIRGLDNRNFERKLNKMILHSSTKSRQSMIESSRNYNKNSIKDKLPAIKFEYTEGFSVIPSINPYYNLALFSYKYSGGAHGESTINYIVLDTKSNSIVHLKDIFKSNVDYLYILNNQLAVQLTSLQETTSIPLYIQPKDVSISENQNFYIDVDGNIVIVFNIYEIAPYVAGTIEVIIPKSNISIYMK